MAVQVLLVSGDGLFLGAAGEGDEGPVVVPAHSARVGERGRLLRPPLGHGRVVLLLGDPLAAEEDLSGGGMRGGRAGMDGGGGGGGVDRGDGVFLDLEVSSPAGDATLSHGLVHKVWKAAVAAFCSCSGDVRRRRY